MRFPCLHHANPVLLRCGTITSAAPTTSTREDPAHAEPADDGKTAGHASARHGRGLESAGARPNRDRVEFQRTTSSAGGPAMELAGEPVAGTKTQSGQAARIRLRGGHRLPGSAGPG